MLAGLEAEGQSLITKSNVLYVFTANNYNNIGFDIS